MIWLVPGQTGGHSAANEKLVAFAVRLGVVCCCVDQPTNYGALAKLGAFPTPAMRVQDPGSHLALRSGIGMGVLGVYD